MDPGVYKTILEPSAAAESFLSGGMHCCNRVFICLLSIHAQVMETARDGLRPGYRLEGHPVPVQPQLPYLVVGQQYPANVQRHTHRSTARR